MFGGGFYRRHNVLHSTHNTNRRPQMKVYELGPFIIVFSIYRLAKKSLPQYKHRRGPKTYKLWSKIAMVAWVSLHGRSYYKALDDSKRDGLYRRLRLEKTPSRASVSRWKKALRLYFRLLLRLTF